MWIQIKHYQKTKFISFYHDHKIDKWSSFYWDHQIEKCGCRADSFQEEQGKWKDAKAEKKGFPEPPILQKIIEFEEGDYCRRSS